MRVRKCLTATAAAAACLTGAASANGVTFSASGDFGQLTEGSASTANARAVIDQIAASNSSFHLALGDFSYSTAGSEIAFCNGVKSRVGATFPFQLLAGNHDTGERNSANTGWEAHIDEYVKCLPNQMPGLVGDYGRRWYVDVPQINPVVRIVMGSPSLNFHTAGTPDFTEDRYTPGTAGYTFMSNAIDDARAKKIPWVITGVHYPCITPGNYNCSAGFSMGTDLLDLFITKKVDLILNGHEHLYARSHQLGYGPGCDDETVLKPVSGKGAAAHDPDCIRNATSAMRQGDGTVIAIVGSGGRPMYPIDPTDREIGYFASWTASNANPTFGNLMLDATTSQLRGTFARAIGGTYSDTFTITRDVPTPPADRDRDGVADTVDLCPSRPGPASRRGCPTTFTGTSAANAITGSPFNDVIWGLAGHDVLRGGLGNDRLYGGIGRDTLIGDAGNDILVGGTQRDTFWAGKGNDVINSRDGMREVVNCGAGTDRVIADRLDVVRSCEKVTRK